MASGLHADKELSHGNFPPVTDRFDKVTEIGRLRVSEDSGNGKKRRQDVTNTMFAATKGNNSGNFSVELIM
jgi:hypothetical protein